jgi:hypothetical protein
MSLIIKGMKLPQHAAVNGEKDTAYKCVILAHPDNSAELVIDSKFASAYDNGHNIQRYPLTEIPTPHGRLIDASEVKHKMLTFGFKAPDMTKNELLEDEITTVIKAEVSE